MTSPGEGGVLVTLREIYQLVVGLSARVDTVLSNHAQTERTVAEQKVRVEDHETRIRTIERSRWPLTSVTVLIGIAALLIAIYRK